MNSTVLVTENENARYIGDEIIQGKDVLTQSVFKEIENLFKNHTHIEITEYIDVKNEIATIVYVGSRFATVRLSNGYKVAINYGGILDNQNQKEEIVSRIKFI